MDSADGFKKPLVKAAIQAAFILETSYCAGLSAKLCSWYTNRPRQELAIFSDEKRLHELCELTSKEQDPEKLIELAAELNRILESRIAKNAARQGLNVFASR